MATKDQVLEMLKRVVDPELNRDIVSLGMVRQVEVEDGIVHLHLETTTPVQALREAVERQVRRQLLSLQGIRDIDLQITMRRGAAFNAKMPVEGITHVAAVASGKGGVGKTTVAVNLALAVARLGYRVGLMDGDIYGPNVPMMLGIPAHARPEVSEAEKMIPLEAHGLKIISMGILVAPDQPMVWRGPMLHSAVTQFVQKVEWGELDFLFVDLPPGTGDVQLSLVQTVPLSGAIIVTTPQEVALLDVRKGIAMFRKTEVPILGVVENMTGEIFGKGGGRKIASELEVPFLGEIPLDQKIREGADAGRPIVVSVPEAPASQSFMQAAEVVVECLMHARRQG